jgi:hypothetical protein
MYMQQPQPSNRQNVTPIPPRNGIPRQAKTTRYAPLNSARPAQIISARPAQLISASPAQITNVSLLQSETVVSTANTILDVAALGNINFYSIECLDFNPSAALEQSGCKTGTNHC